LSLTNLQIINPITYPGWDELLLRTPGASFFHSSAWAKVLAESYGYTPLYFTVLENGKLRALVPVMEVNSFLTGKRGVSLPFTDYCEPIVSETSEFVVLFNSIIEYGKKKGWKYVELRGGEKNLRSQESGVSSQESGGSNLSPKSLVLGPGLNTEDSFIPQSAIHNPQSEGSQPAMRNESSFFSTPYPLLPTPCPFKIYLGHTLDLTKGEENIFSNLRDGTRRNIKKAIKEKVRAEIFNSLESIKEFYRLNCMTRKEHDLPPQPFNFFKKIFDNVISKNLGLVILASYEDKNVAGGVYFHFGEKAVYKYGASEMAYQNLRANNLVMWEAIKWYCHNGFDHFCFGRTEPENQGLIQFKSGWGTAEQKISYYLYDFRKEEFISAKSKVTGFHNKIFRNMPLPLLKKLGSVIYKHVG